MLNDSQKNVNNFFTSEEKDILLQHFPFGIVAIDFETTGLSSIFHEIIEVAAVKLLPSGEVGHYSQLVRPTNMIEASSTEIHGITNEMVSTEPGIAEVLPQLLRFFGTLPLLAHNAQFDIGFLVMSCHKHQLGLNENLIYDSCKIARKNLRKEAENYKLSTLAGLFDIPLKNHHRALEDSLVCLKLLAKILLYKKCQFDFVDTLKSYHHIEIDKLSSELQQLLEKKAHEEIFLLEYPGKSIKEKLRPVKYICFIPTPNGTVLYGLCLKSNIHKYFKIAKIKSIQFLSREEQNEYLNDNC